MVKTAVEPEFVTTVTPSGIEVLYQWAPKRLYRVRAHLSPEDASFPKLWEAVGVEKDEEGRFLGEWAEVPSVTTVLEVLDKPALPWWGMTEGVEGVAILFNMGMLARGEAPNGQQMLCARDGQGGWVAAGKDEIVKLLQKHKLTVNDKKDKAGDRGQGAHDAFEVWAKEGHLPDPDMFPQEERGYIEGLLQFFAAVPSAEPLESEVMVGSVEHGYAGRYDVRFRTTEEHQIVFHRTPVRGPQYATLKPGVYLADLKTSKRVYPISHFRQLEAYEGASIECGYEPTDARGVIHVHPGDPKDDKMPDGPHYEFVRSYAVLDDFLRVLEVYRSEAAMKERKP